MCSSRVCLCSGWQRTRIPRPFRNSRMQLEVVANGRWPISRHEFSLVPVEDPPWICIPRWTTARDQPGPQGIPGLSRIYGSFASWVPVVEVVVTGEVASGTDSRCFNLCLGWYETAVANPGHFRDGQWYMLRANHLCRHSVRLDSTIYKFRSEELVEVGREGSTPYSTKPQMRFEGPETLKESHNLFSNVSVKEHPYIIFRPMLR